MENAKVRIAFIDDEVFLVDSFQLLHGSQYIVDPYYSAEMFLRKTQSSEDYLASLWAIVVDYNLGGGMNGAELIKHIAGRDPTINCIILTGFGTKDVVQQALANGAFAYEEKDTISRSQLVTKLEKAIYETQRQRMERDLLMKADSLQLMLLEERKKHTYTDIFYQRLAGAVHDSGHLLRQLMTTSNDQVEPSASKEEMQHKLESLKSTLRVAVEALHAPLLKMRNIQESSSTKGVFLVDYVKEIVLMNPENKLRGTFVAAEETSEVTIIAAPDSVLPMLCNVLENAFHHTKGKVQVALTVLVENMYSMQDAAKGGALVFPNTFGDTYPMKCFVVRIRDEGPGMQVSRLRDALTTGIGDPNSKGGIGLRSLSGLVLNTNSCLCVWTAPDQGTTVDIILAIE